MGLAAFFCPLYTSNEVSNDISVVDVTARKTVKFVTTGQLPWGVAAKD
jgi:YVTN family beta-propeller protein